MTRAAGLLILILALAVPSAKSGTLAESPTSPRLIQLFDMGWRFHLGDAAGAWEPGFDDRDWRTLDLPHDWSIELPFDAKLASGTGYLPGGYGWYRKTFQLPAAAAGKRVSIRFDGVYMNSEVWVNGHALGKRPYGYVSFEYDLTPYVIAGARQNVLAVRVDHSNYADSRWYTGSGIYRHAWMTITGDVHIAPWGTYITIPQLSRQSAVIAINTKVRNNGAGARDVVLQSTILDSVGKTVATTESAHAIRPGEEYRFEQGVRMPDPKLWSPDAPYLYKLSSRLKAGNTVVDEYETPLGLRTVFFDPDKGFFLNGIKTVIGNVYEEK